MWFPLETSGNGSNAPFLNQNGLWEIDIGPFNENRVIEFIVVQGPTSSSVDVFLDTIFLDTTPRGDKNRAEYLTGIPFASGRLLKVVWTGGASTVKCTVGLSDGNTQYQPAEYRENWAQA